VSNKLEQENYSPPPNRENMKEIGMIKTKIYFKDKKAAPRKTTPRHVAIIKWSRI